MASMMRRPAWRIAAGVAATALLLAVYARVPQAWALGFVVLAPWLLALEGLRLRGALLAGVAMAFAFVAAVFGWFGAAVGAFVGVGAFAGTLAVLLAAPLLQPQLIAYALARQLAGRRHGAAMRALVAASAWVGCEALLPKLLGDTLGHGLYPSALLRQFADLGGAAGITFALLLVNEAVAHAITRRATPRAWWTPLALAGALVAAWFGYGHLRLASLDDAAAPQATPLRVAMIQASITDYERLRREQGAYAVVRHVLDTHYALSFSAVRDHGADVLLWSETVYPTTYGHPRSADGAALDREIQDFVDTLAVPLVFGSYDVDAAGEYNAAVFLQPGRGVLGRYRKTHPFPLTEHVPAWLDGPLLRRALPWAGGWQAGDGARVLPLRSVDGREVNVVPLVCLDDVHPQLAIDGARLGAQAILGMSNDSWFTAHPLGMRLHLTVAAFRSIETRLPQVRVTTNGLSAIIDHAGAVQAQTGIGDQAVLTAQLQPRDPAPTLMVRWGDWVGRAAAALLLLVCLHAAWRTWRARGGGAHAASVTAVPGHAVVALLSPGQRVLAGALRLCAGLALAWLGFDMLHRTGVQVNSLSQLRQFLALVVLPLLLAGALLRWHAAHVRVEGEVLAFRQRRRRIEVPLASLAGLRDWRLPLPSPGTGLQLASGRRFAHGLAGDGVHALARMLASAGVAAVQAKPGDAWQRLATARQAARHRWLDHPLLKFALFPLLPALVAFRLHQVIAFGGSFGEWQTYGFQAWATGLLIWWASWSLGMMLFAALVRVGIEAASALAAWLSPARAGAVRGALEAWGRAAFFLGVPAWLAWRVLGNG